MNNPTNHEQLPEPGPEFIMSRDTRAQSLGAYTTKTPKTPSPKGRKRPSPTGRFMRFMLSGRELALNLTLACMVVLMYVCKLLDFYGDGGYGYVIAALVVLMGVNWALSYLNYRSKGD
jgi:hypothetical protein